MCSISINYLEARISTVRAHTARHKQDRDYEQDRGSDVITVPISCIVTNVQSEPLDLTLHLTIPKATSEPTSGCITYSIVRT